jgi:hypothetical protein
MRFGTIICYMRAIVADDWPVMERGSRLEVPRTLVFGDRVRAGVRGLPLDDERQRAAYGRASTLITDAGASRQQLLFFTQPEVPNALWVLIYVGAFLLVFLLGTHYADRPRDRFAALATVAALLTVQVVVLSMLDNPFAAGARVHPDSMREGIDLVSVGEEKAGVLRPCPERPRRIAGSALGSTNWLTRRSVRLWGEHGKPRTGNLCAWRSQASGSMSASQRDRIGNVAHRRSDLPP